MSNARERVLRATHVQEAIFEYLDKSTLARCAVASSIMFVAAVTALYRSVTRNQLRYIIFCPLSKRTSFYLNSITRVTEGTTLAELRQLSAPLPSVQAWSIASNIQVYGDIVFHVERPRHLEPPYSYRVIRVTASAVLTERRFDRLPRPWPPCDELPERLQISSLRTWDYIASDVYDRADISKLEDLTILSKTLCPVHDAVGPGLDPFNGIRLLAQVAASVSLTRLTLQRQGAHAFEIICDSCVNLVELSFSWLDPRSSYDISIAFVKLSRFKLLARLQLKSWKPYNASLKVFPKPVDARTPTYPRMEVLEVGIHHEQYLEGLLVLCLQHIPASCVVETADRYANSWLAQVRNIVYDSAFEGLASWSYTGKA